MAANHHIQGAIGRVHLVHRGQNRQMFDIFDVRVGIGIDMRVKSSCTPNVMSDRIHHQGGKWALPLPASL